MITWKFCILHWGSFNFLYSLILRIKGYDDGSYNASFWYNIISRRPFEITVKTSFRLRFFFIDWCASKIITCRNIGERITQNKDTQCLKITENVLFSIASEASYVYILGRQKFIKNAEKLVRFWKPKAFGHRVLPDRLILIGQKLV